MSRSIEGTDVCIQVLVFVLSQSHSFLLTDYKMTSFIYGMRYSLHEDMREARIPH